MWRIKTILWLKNYREHWIAREDRQKALGVKLKRAGRSVSSTSMGPRPLFSRRSISKDIWPPELWQVECTDAAFDSPKRGWRRKRKAKMICDGKISLN